MSHCNQYHTKHHSNLFLARSGQLLLPPHINDRSHVLLNGYSRGSYERAQWRRCRRSWLAGFGRSRPRWPGGSHWLLGWLGFRFGRSRTFVAEPAILAAVPAVLDSSRLAGDRGFVSAGSFIFLPFTLSNFFPAAFALRRTGELVGGTLARVSKGDV